MTNIIISVLETILLVVALSVDSFIASFAYGTNKIKIPFISVLIISVICSLFLALSLFLASVISPVLPPLATKILCFLILFILGVIKLFDSSIKSLIRKHRGITKQLKFSMFSLNFILNIYADPEDADTDSSRDLSPYEAVSLAIALSLDGLAAGFGAGLVNFSLMVVFAFSIIFGILAILLGCRLGNKIAGKLSVNISWLSGALLAFLGILKLIS